MYIFWTERMKKAYLVISYYKDIDVLHGVALTEDAAYKKAYAVRKEIVKTLRTQSPIRGIKDHRFVPKDTPSEIKDAFVAWYEAYQKAKKFKKCVIEEMDVLE